MVFPVVRGGSFSGSAEETNTSIPGRSDRPSGLSGDGISNFSLRTLRSVMRLMGKSFGSWSSTQENANQISHTTDIPHSHIASGLLCRTRQIRKRTSTTIRINTNNLPINQSMNQPQHPTPSCQQHCLHYNSETSLSMFDSIAYLD